MFFCVVLYGLFHGLCYLPVLLSAIGPSPYESALAHAPGTDHKDGRRSPIHPAGMPGDNVSYELAVAKGKKPPATRDSQPVAETTQNGDFRVPVADYEGESSRCTVCSKHVICFVYHSQTN